MAAQSLRSRRHSRRIYEIHSRSNTLLFGLHLASSWIQAMTCPCSRSRFHWVRQLCSLICLVTGCCSLPVVRAQNLDKPVQTIDEDITAFAYTPDGRIVYSVHRSF